MTSNPTDPTFARLRPAPLVAPLVTADPPGLVAVPAPVVELVPVVVLAAAAVAFAAAWKASKDLAAVGLTANTIPFAQ